MWILCRYSDLRGGAAGQRGEGGALGEVEEEEERLGGELAPPADVPERVRGVHQLQGELHTTLDHIW